ncbi:hypothetical protein DFQ28_002501 [Apophysomyces sp. BC1034]|nr:hypothetical protein DFQ30_001236 [Apophysomyces sp. BC1015]KAG0178476.1 hypothetical protein DFQ29_003415 [Apophysomyces sp. BC1021]KAG0190089.1 hypothetical protein DFQ28_002501 [Apophysomyces sp. BC1034]
MPMTKDLEHVHEQLLEVARETQQISHTKYTADDIRHLQNKLHHIDEKYKQGCIDDRDTKNLSDDPYEHEGQAQVTDELERIHQTLHIMLSRIE